jgi:hypothetical protein
MKTYGIVEVQLNGFLTSALGGVGVMNFTSSAALLTGIETLVPTE